eukprot:GEMP01009207.1.p1 GENE.GEMP01009207.1~~GEMP01009207.1.p1  ORF type:complete len:1043 (+),score=247.06 GEMP01009207.1:88-3129(+)
MRVFRRFKSFEAGFQEGSRIIRQKHIKDLKLKPVSNRSSTQDISFWQELRQDDNTRAREARRPTPWQAERSKESGRSAASTQRLPNPEFSENNENLIPASLEGNDGHYATIAVAKDPTELSLRREKADLTEELGEALANADPQEIALLQMRPEHIAVQQSLMKSKSVGQVLGLATQDLDAINMATAIHRLGRFVTPYSRPTLTSDSRFRDLINNTEKIIDDLTPRGIANVFWALVRLEYSPKWMPKLLEASHRSLPVCDPAHLSTTLYCLAKMPSLYAVPEGEALKSAAQEAIAERVEEFETPLDIVCALAGMSKLKLRNEQVFARLAEKAQSQLRSFDFDDLASIAWSFANMGLTEGKLFRSIRQRLENEIEFCTPKALVQLCWALSKAEETDEELFRYIFAPAIRGFMLDFQTKDLCTILWSYCNAHVLDDALFRDLAQALMPKVKEMNAHDVASVVVAFATVDFQASAALYKKLGRQAVQLQATFSPLQVSRALYGFGCAAQQDLRVMQALLDEAYSKRHLLYGRNVTDILTGLAETRYFPEDHLPWLFTHAAKSVNRLSAEDTIALMHVLSRLPKELRDKCVTDLPEELVNHLKTKHRGWWRFSAQEVADTLEALKVLRMPDEYLTELIMRQLGKMLEAPTTSLQLVLRVAGELASQPADMAELIRTHFHKRPKIREALCTRLQEMFPCNLDFHHSVLLYTTLATLGLDTDTETRALFEKIERRLESGVEETEDMDDIGHLCWALCELNWKPQLALTLAFRFVDANPECSQQLKLRVGWAFCVLNEPLPVLLVEAMASDGLPKDEFLHMAQAIAWDVKDTADDFSPTVIQWLQDVREIPRIDVHALPKAPRKQPSKAKEYPSAKWLSDTLIDLQVAHTKHFVVENTHRVTIGLPKEQHVIDCTAFKDMSFPSLRITGGCIVRRRQLVEMGYTVSEVNLRELWQAMQDKTIRQFVGGLLPKVERHTNPKAFLPPQGVHDPLTEGMMQDLYGTRQKVTVVSQNDEKKTLKI